MKYYAVRKQFIRASSQSWNPAFIVGWDKLPLEVVVLIWIHNIFLRYKIYNKGLELARHLYNGFL